MQADYKVVIVDNLYNSSEEVINRIELISGKKPIFYKGDITNEADMDKIFTEHPDINNVILFAALKAVGESGEVPLEYYRVNVGGAIHLLRSMEKHNVTNIVFSSSATVYGDATRVPGMIPIPEHCPIGPTNTYGRTKVTVEQIISDQVNAKRNKAKKEGKSGAEWNAALLRYFNPAGAHPSGLMGENPLGVPYNLLPLLAQVAVGKREKLLVFGDSKNGASYEVSCTTDIIADYDSKDGTAIRDYIHILDLARGHLMALNYLREQQPGVKAWNLGTGRGSTVFEMIKAFNTACGKELAYQVVERRQGDVLNLTANAALAHKELGWKTEFTLEDACKDLWKWTSNNPEGYGQEPPKQFVDETLAARK